ncbi:MAG: hypothetical protein GWO20_10655 [Candidatus Korarchaeota archaeon]|nr:hypothetical protein [Candidatus Korarchaeota archaeon]NIU83943.1 hypothetical protein [Candidatus Thorarchaeota archaeon]NIW14071.1 hypothetical protein [Candidatus Thorarchaeota archaeon]NIW52181.1 hypothetical protein [Candidatus Korarchaeota archaeon]
MVSEEYRKVERQIKSLRKVRSLLLPLFFFLIFSLLVINPALLVEDVIGLKVWNYGDIQDKLFLVDVFGYYNVHLLLISSFLSVCIGVLAGAFATILVGRMVKIKSMEERIEKADKKGGVLFGIVSACVLGAFPLYVFDDRLGILIPDGLCTCLLVGALMGTTLRSYYKSKKLSKSLASKLS